MDRKNKIYSGLLTVLFFIALTSIALSPAGEWIGNTVSGFLNPATEDLDMANNDIKMGTGLIGYNGTASKGLSFDSGNEVVTLLSGTFKSAAFFAGTGTSGFNIGQNAIYGSSLGAYVLRTSGNATTPNFTFFNDQDTGSGRAAADQLSHTTGGRETMRMISWADTDSDDNDVGSTGVSGFHGMVLVRSITDNTSAMYRVSDTTVIDVSLDGDHTSTATTATHYNFYYDTDQFKLENKTGDNKSVSVVFWVLPT